MELFDLAMKWIVAPLMGVVIWLLKRVSTMATEIKVLETKIEAQGQMGKRHDHRPQCTAYRGTARFQGPHAEAS